MSPRAWATLEEAHLRLKLAREDASNRDFAQRCPGARETECYRRGLPPKSTYFTERDFLLARIDHERSRFNPSARCPTSGCAGHRKR